MREARISYRGKALLLAPGLLLVMACPLPQADFSAYVGTNLIPDAQLDNAGWTTDQDIGSAPGNLYMDYVRIDTLGAALPTQAGFADAAALYSGLPSGAYDANGNLPPVYRLEIKNLFRDGDFEASVPTPTALAPVALSQDTTQNPAKLLASADIASMSRIAGADATGISSTARMLIHQDDALNFKAVDATEHNGNALHLNTFGSGNTVIDLGDTSRSTMLWPANASFNLSFRYYANQEDIPLAIDDGTDAVNGYSDDILVKKNLAGSAIQVFPFDTVTVSSTINSTNGKRFMSFNPRIKATSKTKVIIATIDDIKLTQVDKTYALRFEIPKLTASGLALPQGGTYTLKLWIRCDPTTLADASGTKLRPNSFPATGISLALIDDTGHSDLYWPGTVAAGPTGGSWTELSASFSGLLSNASLYQDASDSTKLLQISITATDTNGGFTRRTPGSILMASPKLYWEP